MRAQSKQLKMHVSKESVINFENIITDFTADDIWHVCPLGYQIELWERCDLNKCPPNLIHSWPTQVPMLHHHSQDKDYVRHTVFLTWLHIGTLEEYRVNYSNKPSPPPAKWGARFLTSFKVEWCCEYTGHIPWINSFTFSCLDQTRI